MRLCAFFQRQTPQPTSLVSLSFFAFPKSKTLLALDCAQHYFVTLLLCLGRSEIYSLVTLDYPLDQQASSDNLNSFPLVFVPSKTHPWSLGFHHGREQQGHIFEGRPFFRKPYTFTEDANQNYLKTAGETDHWTALQNDAI